MDNNGEIIIYQTDDGSTHIDVKMEDETVWLTQAQMADLYQTSRTNVVEHIKHIFEEGEFEENAVVRKFRTTAADGKKSRTQSQRHLSSWLMRGYAENHAFFKLNHHKPRGLQK